MASLAACVYPVFFRLSWSLQCLGALPSIEEEGVVRGKG